MARHKKDSRALNIKIDKALFEQLDRYCSDVDRTKTAVIERLLKKCFEEYYGIQNQDQ
jgi:predicted transcriptional regulator